MLNLALDIGYSNVKMAWEENGNPVQTHIMPANAGPADRFPTALAGTVNSVKEPLRVILDNKPWVAGVEPGRLQEWSRELHKDYVSSNSYRALFYGALALMPNDRIDHVVTGLPVSLSKDPEEVQKVMKVMEGEHQITPNRTVTVDKVSVLPQPAGTYMTLIKTIDNIKLVQQGRVVTIDSGFFSVDYIVIDSGELRDRLAGTSTKAMSVVLSTTSRLIAEEIGVGPGSDRLEKAMQEHKKEVLVSGREINITPYFDKASEIVAEEALVEMRKDMRGETDNVDVLVLTGGGANAYAKAAKKIFPACQNVITPQSPELANVMGYLAMAQVIASQKAA